MGTLREAIERIRHALIGGQAEAALLPCQEILARYPKHVEANTLLAEARRELRQLPQAADLFERVIAADPESLIGHWGLATILEERDDHEGALYELSIAWDVSPGQTAVAEELRRLRDAAGWPPGPVELTGAGLARVYRRGHQYRRALAETRRALVRSPERLDVMALECECLWRLGRTGEAAEVAADLLLEAPDCLKANLIRGYARLEAGPRGLDEARKLLVRALALDPECLVAVTLFPDRSLPLPLSRAEVDLDGEPPALRLAEPAGAMRTRTSLVVAVDPEPAAAIAVEPPAESLRPLVNEPSSDVTHFADPPGGPASTPMFDWDTQPDGTEPAVGVASDGVVASDGAASRDDDTTPVEPVALNADEPEPEPAVLAVPVPEWLAREAPAAQPELPGGLDPALYAEWADLLGEEVELDADSVARLEAALSEATGAGSGSGAWREVVLDRDALAATTPGAATAPPALVPAPVSTQTPEPGQDLETQLARARALAADGDTDRAAEAYRELLRAHAEAARDLVEEICRLVDGAPGHGGLRRALGDAYMRSGRFQKAIDEYNRAAAAREPAAVA